MIKSFMTTAFALLLSAECVCSAFAQAAEENWTLADRRFKVNMRPLDHVGERLEALRPVSFCWKEDYVPNAPRQIGLIAQEVKTVFPEIVYYDVPQDQYYINYQELIPLLIQALQDFEIRIQETDKAYGEKQKEHLELLQEIYRQEKQADVLVSPEKVAQLVKRLKRLEKAGKKA